MEIICISDTHNKHESLVLPAGDVLLHAGDITESGTEREVRAFLKWFSAQEHRYKIFIAGNHDFFLENILSEKLAETLPENVIYLQENKVEIDGVSFWGSPVTPGDESWAFSENPVNDFSDPWKKIPPDIDVLITHSPPFGILDESDQNQALGSKSLLRKIMIVKPQYHIFGHTHENYGKVKRGNTVFVNATTFNQREKLVNPPLKIQI